MLIISKICIFSLQSQYKLSAEAAIPNVIYFVFLTTYYLLAAINWVDGFLNTFLGILHNTKLAQLDSRSTGEDCLLTTAKKQLCTRTVVIMAGNTNYLLSSALDVPLNTQLCAHFNREYTCSQNVPYCEILYIKMYLCIFVFMYSNPMFVDLCWY